MCRSLPRRARYRLFGGILESELAFPELQGRAVPAADACAPPDWVLRVATGPLAPDAVEAEPVGSEVLADGVIARLARGAGGWRLTYDDTGDFVLTPDGGEITWYPGSRSTEVGARTDVLSRVLAVALHARGRFCLHASAVACPGGAVAFAGPKLHGKSTLATALACAGAALLTDDALAIDVDAAPTAFAGTSTVRLWEDSARAVGADGGAWSRDEPVTAVASARKHVLHEVATLAPDAAIPLAAVYVLAPRRGAAAVVARRQLAPMPSTLALVGLAKLGALAGGVVGAETLQRAARIAAVVPVHRLEVERDFARLPEVVATLLAWHGAAR